MSPSAVAKPCPPVSDDLSSRIRIVPAEAPLNDVMRGASRWEIKVHEHGFVALIDVMPRLVPAAGLTDAVAAGESPGAVLGADGAIVQAARVSYGAGTRKVTEDRGLVRYLMRHHHTTPFEMIEFKFHVAMPIFIARQWIRHRTANVNEYSARYSIMPDRFYRPSEDNIRKQSAGNRQGGTEPIDAGTAEEFLALLEQAEASYKQYIALTEKGLSRELARIGLPVSVYTEWYWKCDLHNIFHFLALRMDPHAQQEIQDFARAMYALIKPIVPVACEAFEDYRLNGLHLTSLEVEAIKTGKPPATENKREQAEWETKKARLGM